MMFNNTTQTVTPSNAGVETSARHTQSGEAFAWIWNGNARRRPAVARYKLISYSVCCPTWRDERTVKCSECIYRTASRRARSASTVTARRTGIPYATANWAYQLNSRLPL